MSMSSPRRPAPTMPWPPVAGWSRPPTTCSAQRGYLGTTITAVAHRAGVAVPTIYYTFGTKAVLLEESLGAAIVGFDRWHEPPADPSIDELLPWHHWWTEFNDSPTSAEALHHLLHPRRRHPRAGGPARRHPARCRRRPGGSGRGRGSAEQRRVESYRETVRVIAANPAACVTRTVTGEGNRHPGRALQRRALPVDPAPAEDGPSARTTASPARPAQSATARPLTPRPHTSAWRAGQDGRCERSAWARASDGPRQSPWAPNCDAPMLRQAAVAPFSSRRYRSRAT